MSALKPTCCEASISIIPQSAGDASNALLFEPSIMMTTTTTRRSLGANRVGANATNLIIKVAHATSVLSLLICNSRCKQNKNRRRRRRKVASLSFRHPSSRVHLSSSPPEEERSSQAGFYSPPAIELLLQRTCGTQTALFRARELIRLPQVPEKNIHPPRRLPA